MCKENDYQKPILTTERMIDIKQGRHPLQEHCVDNYVPNDVKASDKSELVTILTGPNACGKSVYLKQVALIIYMAHIGCYVPAEYAKIPLLNNIHTRIQTVENAVTRMSAFLIDLRQVKLKTICKNKLYIKNVFYFFRCLLLFKPQLHVL